MDNMKIYNASRSVPKDAKREIQAGRLKGKTDINPMWRIKLLTEQFGPCGIGWKYTIDKQWIEESPNKELSAFVNISLYFKHEGEWSDAIPGTGGSSFVANESKGPYTSDECFKMALTDAISVSCKALGVGADVYWDKDINKHDKPSTTPQTPQSQPQTQHPSQPTNTPPEVKMPSDGQFKRMRAIASGSGKTDDEIKTHIADTFKKQSSKDLTLTELNKLIEWLEKK